MSADEQRAQVRRLRQEEIREGTSRYLVSARWYKQWAEYVQLEAPTAAGTYSPLREEASAPPPIDNTDLLADGVAGKLGALRPDVEDGTDYQFLPEAAWKYLHGVYGGGPECRREVVLRGGAPVVDRFPLIVTVECLAADGTRVAAADGASSTLLALSRDMVARQAIVDKMVPNASKANTELGETFGFQLWAHERALDLELADGPMPASVLRGWKRLQVGEEDRLGELPIKDGQCLLLEQRDFGEWRFEALVRRACGSKHWKDPATDSLEVGDRVDYRSQDAAARWYAAQVVALGTDTNEGHVRLRCPALSGAGEALDEGKQLSASIPNWVPLSALAKWHSNKLSVDDPARKPFDTPRDLRVGDECDVFVGTAGQWSSATVRSVDWEDMSVEVTLTGAFGDGTCTVALDGVDLASPGSMVAAAMAAPQPAAEDRGMTASALPAVEELGGICGLNNLGNTCFMNAALQALSNTPSWRDYFVSGRYAGEINESNPLGHGGKIAQAYGGVMKEIWSNRHNTVSPAVLKREIGSSASGAQFAGYQQHDSQELLAFLLDAIHEDLNLVRDKPSTEAPEHDGSKDDDGVAREAWEQYLRRNQSVVVDHFQGQLRSEAKCLECGRISIKFDETMYLTVPLPRPTTKSQLVHVVRGVGGARRTFRQMSVEVPLQGIVADLRSKLVEMTGIESECLYLCEVYGQRVYKAIANSSALSTIQVKDLIYAYEVPEGASSAIQVLLRKPSTTSYGGPEKFAYPLMLGRPEGCTNRELRSRVMALAKQMLKPGEGERFLRMQEAAEMALGPALEKAKGHQAEGGAKVASGDLQAAVACFTEGIDLLASRTASGAEEATERSDGSEQHGVRIACREGRAQCNIELAATLDCVDTTVKLDAAVCDCETVLAEDTQHPGATLLRGRAALMRVDRLTLPDDQLRELRYAKGLFWKASELELEPAVRQEVSDQRVEINTKLEALEKSIVAKKSGLPPNQRSKTNLYCINKRTDTIELHWVRKAATESCPAETKNFATLPNAKGGIEHIISTRVGDRWMVYSTAGSKPVLREITCTTKPNLIYLHDDEETQQKLTCEWFWKHKGLSPSEVESRSEAAAQPDAAAAANGPYAINTADAVRSEAGKPLVNNDEPFTAGATEAVCIDWTKAGLEARDDSFDKAESDSALGSAGGVEGALLLTDCIDKFCELEELGEDDLWFCPQCKQLRRCTKQFKLWTMPNVLIVHLKRFSQTNVRNYSYYGTMATTEKITTPVDFPMELDMSKYVKGGRTEHTDDAEGHMYDLYAVINQSGGLAGGHYYTYARTLSKVKVAEWYNYNDSYVSRIHNPEEVRTPCAYVLFYQRRGWNGGRGVAGQGQ